MFLERCLELCVEGGAASLVLPQNWLFLTGYRKLREKLLKTRTWRLLARLGPGAFETISGEVVKAVLLTLTEPIPPAIRVDCSMMRRQPERCTAWTSPNSAPPERRPPGCGKRKPLGSSKPGSWGGAIEGQVPPHLHQGSVPIFTGSMIEMSIGACGYIP